jgi:hypothetical protein
VLWPDLRRELRGVRADLDTILDELRRSHSGVPSAGSWLAREDELAARTRPAGWCLGVLAAAQGVDLLRERREADGLRWMVAATTEARGWTLEPRAERLPGIAGSACAHWAISLLGAWCALRACEGSSGVVRWHSDEHGAGRRLAFELGSQRAAPEVSHFSGARVDLPHVELARGQLSLLWR